MSPLDIVLPIRVKRIERSVAAEMENGGDQNSHAAGYTAGYEEGRLRAEWEAGKLRQTDSARVQKLMKTLENLHAEFEGLLAEHLPDLIQGALKRVFRKHPFTVEEIGAEVIALLREMEHAGRISLECCRVDAEDLADRLQVAQVVPNDAKWTLEANESLQPGEFILKSDLGDVDGRHSSRIRQIHLALEGKS
jgi:flagellar biosynthesis/type III secretory pathway protein FliH